MYIKHSNYPPTVDSPLHTQLHDTLFVPAFKFCKVVYILTHMKGRRG